MPNIFQKGKRFYPLFLLFLLAIILFLTNYQKGTWLVGWDNLYPEINFATNLERNIFSVWQEYRGLGLPDGLAHAANLPHAFFLWLLHFILPLNFLRYFFLFLMHLLGGLGIYFLLEKIFLKNKQENKLLALLGAVFYSFNLFTIQIFYAPLEVFIIHFAFLPWLVFSLLNYLVNSQKKNLLFFIILSILSLPQGFVPQVFLSYLMAVFFILFFYWFKQPFKNLKKVIFVLAIIFAINSFWLLPYLYSTITNSEVIINSKINQMSNEDIFLKNKFRGTLTDVATLKGFMLDVIEPINSGEPDYIMKDWRILSKTLPYQLFTGFLFLIAIIGAFHSLFKRKWIFFPFLACFLISFLFLANEVPLISSFNSFLRNQFPLFKEAFRFPFTKFAVLFVFSYALLLSSGVALILRLFKKLNQRVLINQLILFILIGLIIASVYPAFKGNFLFDSIQLKIPQDYFQTINFFKQENKNTRIAILPQPTYWNWRFYRWNYRGSGFLWYGIEQPTLYRAFDPWSDKNENYYWEISQTIYSKNKELFENVLEKYQINWLLFDRNMINPSSPKALYTDELAEMLSKSEKISLSKEFGEIDIYKVNLETPIDDFVFLAENLPQIGPEYQWNNYDQAFLENNHYLSQEKQIFYPFRSLFTGRGQEDLEFEIEDQDNYFIFKKDFPFSPENYELVLPELEEKELVQVDPDNLANIEYFDPKIEIEKNTLIAKVPKVKGLYSAEIEPFETIDINSPKNCHDFSQGTLENKIIKENGQLWLNLSATDANNCSASLWLPNLSHRYAYLIIVKSQYKQGKSLVFWLENLTSERADMETQLPKKEESTAYFIQPPMTTDGLGYSLHFDNISIGRVKTENNLGRITVNPIPFKLLTGLKLVKTQPEGQRLTVPLTIEHPNLSFYQIRRNPNTKQTLILSQAYHPGWRAYETKENVPQLFVPLMSKKIETHLQVNNWENGWQLNQEEDIALVFLPQYLEYLGFLIFFLFACFTLVFLLKSK